jgi:uncharacterized GH25 family protein
MEWKEQTMTRIQILTLTASLLLVAPALRAHDFWIEPSTFTPEPGQRVAVRLRVGDDFPGGRVPRMARFLERFAVVGKSPEAEVAGVEGIDPAGYVIPGEPGLHVLVYDSRPGALTLSGDGFEKHLAEQGLERVSGLRRERGETETQARELFSRCAKALVAVGERSGEGYDRRVGLPLELVPEKNPFLLSPGEDLPLLLLYQGEPVAGVWVQARNPRRPEESVSGRTDANGRVRLRLASGGFWLVKAVHMVPAPQGAGADWESFWASLTFAASGG